MPPPLLVIEPPFKNHGHVAGQVAVADRVVQRAASVDDEERLEHWSPRCWSVVKLFRWRVVPLTLNCS